MKVVNYSDYEKYLLIADRTHTLSGGYQGFVNFREVIGVIRNMCSKQSTTFEYSGNYHTSKLTLSELSSILNAFDSGSYRNGFEKIKLIAHQLLLQKI
tara:strand:- start:430 stop:723 length:294 start_codon:yes stop_codon:yes gene_type:complete